MAATATWTGANGAAWSTGSNWDTASEPDNATDVVIPDGSVSMPAAPTADKTIANLDITNGTLNASLHLTVSGTSIVLHNCVLSIKEFGGVAIDLYGASECNIAVASGTPHAHSFPDSPAEAAVLFGTSFQGGAKTGAWVKPAVNTVLAPGVTAGGATGASYGAGGNEDGTLNPGAAAVFSGRIGIGL